MKALIAQTARTACALLLPAFLTACASYEVFQPKGEPIQSLPKNSLFVGMRGGNFATSVEKHQPTIYGKPIITTEDKVLNNARIELVKINLERNLAGKLASSLDPYVSKTPAGSKYMLAMQIKLIVADTDGSREVIMLASLFHAPAIDPVWSRTIKVTASRFSSDDAISGKIAEAVVEQMRVSSLIQ